MRTRDSENGSKRKSRQEESKRSGKPIPPEKETGVEQQRVDLRNPEPEAQNQTEEQPLLPHERDQTTRPTGTAAPNSIEQARDVIEQAREDTEHGLKDTDRRGIPSDIAASDVAPRDQNKKQQP